MAEYDILLFGVTGFTGKLAAEYLKEKNYPIKWGVCGRNEGKVKEVLTKLGVDCPVEVADLVVEEGSESYEKLRGVVKKAKVVLTCAGPFEKYGKSLVRLCVEEGVHYADITGESDFLRANIDQFHLKAVEKGVCIVSHCGNDCIPWDATVLAMSKLAKDKGFTLEECSTYTELPPSFAASGGTITTAVHQLGKKRGSKPEASFDPLVMTDKGDKAEYAMKNASPKKATEFKDLKRTGEPWIMAPVMANCVRRSNALLGYNSSLSYSECKLVPLDGSLWSRLKETSTNLLVGASIYLPFLQPLLTQPGEGPSREEMEKGWLKVYGKGVMRKGEESVLLKSSFSFVKDTGYLQTAHMLVESGMLLVQKSKANKCVPGVVTPAVAFGDEIVSRLETQIGAKFVIEVVPKDETSPFLSWSVPR
eukprot:Tamp_10451.p1 GENE.Tamp_10451~~Tamp_10451.p1  ORF type:complete len:420 (+),score=111.92 Tamp_10451:1-1260(+)